MILEWDPCLWRSLPHPPFSGCSVLSVVSRLRAGSALIGWPPEWNGMGKQRPSCYDSFLCSLCMPLELVKLPEDIAEFETFWNFCLSKEIFFCVWQNTHNKIYQKFVFKGVTLS